MIDPTSYIAPGAVVIGDVHVGPEASIWYNCVVRGDMDTIRIGAQTNIQDLTMIHVDEDVPCSIGQRVTAGHRVILHGCTIEDDCLIGMGAIVMNHAHIGAGSIIGSGALVTEGQTIPPASVVLGAPAKVVRSVSPRLQAKIGMAWQHYVANARRHRSGHYRLPTVSSTGG
jgi:carbonic anhydrase/acetyltransferase-like protein (isoleucine patch superfamily)